MTELSLLSIYFKEIIISSSVMEMKTKRGILLMRQPKNIALAHFFP
jgi:hypothetical protein